MTLLEISEILEQIKDIPGFDMGPAATASIERLRLAYNGCGPERWPESIRDALDDITRIFAPSVMVHDLEFDESDGTDERMHEANDRLHRNNRAIVRHYYPLATWRILSPTYRVKRAKAVALMAALNAFTCDALTAKAWNTAYLMNRDKEDC